MVQSIILEEKKKKLIACFSKYLNQDTSSISKKINEIGVVAINSIPTLNTLEELNVLEIEFKHRIMLEYIKYANKYYEENNVAKKYRFKNISEELSYIDFIMMLTKAKQLTDEGPIRDYLVSLATDFSNHPFYNAALSEIDALIDEYVNTYSKDIKNIDYIGIMTIFDDDVVKILKSKLEENKSSKTK